MPALSHVRDTPTVGPLVRRNIFEAAHRESSCYHDRSHVAAKLVPFNRYAPLTIIKRSRFHVFKREKKDGAGASRGENEFATNDAILFAHSFQERVTIDEGLISRFYLSRAVVLIILPSVLSSESSLQDLWEYPSVDVTRHLETADASATYDYQYQVY